MKILAIETSCDETAISLMTASGNLSQPKFKIEKSVIASQIETHRPFGGVVPNLAKREHLKNLPILFGQIFKNPKSKILNLKQILKAKNQKLKAIDLIAVTVGPGLEPCLWAGIEFAKNLYKKVKIKNKKLKLIGANHLEGHLYSFLLPQNTKSKKLKAKSLFPAVHLLVSGGHTILFLMKNLEAIKKLGETRDDAAGESFDKVARLLRLSYPGGPEIEKLAKKGNKEAINFPRPMINQKNYDFSFSGLKTAVLYHLRDNKNDRKEDVVASFQQAAIDVLIKKTLRAAEEFGARSIIISGGVAANKELRKQFKKAAGENYQVIVPDFKYCTDNADMIAAAAYLDHLRRKKYKLEAKGNLSI